MLENYTKVFWHFTGSPNDVRWDLVKKRSDILNFGGPKSPDIAFSILKLILTSKTLKSGKCNEKIVDQLEIKPFCSVTKLPVYELINHSKYFGKVALGFSSTAIKKIFTPVIYKDYDTLPINLDVSIDENAVFDSEAIIGDDNDSGIKLLEFFFNNNQNDYGLAKALKHDLGSVDDIKITEFNDDDDESLSGEGEWRCTGNFYFHNDDVKAIIVPRIYVGEIKEHLAKCQYRNINIIEFESLENA